MCKIKLIIALLLAAAIGACARDQVSSLTEPPLFDEGGADCDWYIDDGACDPPGGYVTYYYESLEGESNLVYDVPTAEAPSYADGAQATCPPGFFRTLLAAAARDDGDPQGRWLPFTSSGWWSLVFNQLFPGPFGRYTWPSGFWPATDGTGRSISIGTGDAWCSVIAYPDNRVGIRIDFFSFHDVEIRRPENGEETGNGGGSGLTCSQEWLILEINYNDGTGWHVLWEGWGEVCE